VDLLIKRCKTHRYGRKAHISHEHEEESQGCINN